MLFKSMSSAVHAIMHALDLKTTKLVFKISDLLFSLNCKGVLVVLTGL